MQASEIKRGKKGFTNIADDDDRAMLTETRKLFQGINIHSRKWNWNWNKVYVNDSFVDEILIEKKIIFFSFKINVYWIMKKMRCCRRDKIFFVLNRISFLDFDIILRIKEMFHDSLFRDMHCHVEWNVFKQKISK